MTAPEARTPRLPRQAVDRDARRLQLARARRRWRFAAPADNPLAPVAIADRVPRGAGYDHRWALPHLPHLARTLVGALAGRVAAAVTRRDPVDAARGMFAAAGLRLPPAAQRTRDVLDDAWFARDWIDGPDPYVLERVRDLDAVLARLALRRSDVPAHPDGASLSDELARGRLFVADYRLLQRALLHGTTLGRDTRWRDKYLPVPLVLLGERPGVDPTCDLVPLAIRVDPPEAQGHNPTHTPRDGAAWDLARLYVRVADFNLQLLSCHLWRHHFVLEAVVTCTHRQLAAEHPVHILLAPHLAYTTAVNRAALGLMQRGGVFDRMYAGRLPETRRILVASHARWNWPELELERDLADRGVDTTPAEYPWRDDARLWTDAIDRFVTGYLAGFYRDDDDVRDDDELAGWVHELAADDGGNLRGLAPVDDVAGLRRLLAQVLFLAGPGHAAAHYPQSDAFAFAPTYPGAAALPPPAEGELVDARRVRATLPGLDGVVQQFLTNQIADYRFDRFGDYTAHALGQVALARAPIARLHTDLDRIERTIEARNRQRRRPYLHLLPSRVPNSTNI